MLDPQVAADNANFVHYATPNKVARDKNLITDEDMKNPANQKELEAQPWDPSVKGLTAVPQVLAMMNDKLDSTQQLGEAFLA